MKLDYDDFMEQCLPHGSGFDCDWEHIRHCKNGTNWFRTYYHNMNENGYYDGYTQVVIELPKGAFEDMRVRLKGKERYTDYHWRNHIWDTINWSITSKYTTLNFEPIEPFWRKP